MLLSTSMIATMFFVYKEASHHLLNPEFWNKRWRNEQIGFHRADANPWLIKYWDHVPVDKGSSVFLPLAGKTLDIAWLVEKGFPVKAIECSPIAVEAFFASQHWSVEKTSAAALPCWQHKAVDFYCGDYFVMSADMLTGVKAIYDRAALIAFPLEQRKHYVEKLLQLLPSRPPILLVTLEYPQDEIKGPPFTVPESEVHALYGADYDIKKLDEASLFATESRWRKMGLSSMDEKVFLLTSKEV